MTEENKKEETSKKEKPETKNSKENKPRSKPKLELKFVNKGTWGIYKGKQRIFSGNLITCRNYLGEIK